MNKETKSTLRWITFVTITAYSGYIIPPLIRSSLSAAQYIVMLIGALVSATLVAVLVYAGYKERKADRFIEEAAERDSFWNIDEMKLQARSMVYKLQNAWDSRNASSIKDYATPSCYEAYCAELTRRPAGDANPNNLLDVHETRIICCEDHPDNDEDKYAAFIDGSLSFGEEEKDFRVVLHFVRSGDGWLLDKICERAGILDLLFTKNVEEGA